MKTLSRRGILLAGLAASSMLAVPGCAPPQARFSPTGPGIVDVVVPYASGGGADNWARFISPYFAKAIEGIHRFQIENVPGGESVTGTNAYVADGNSSGQQILVASGTTYINGLLDRENVEFDFSSLVPLALSGMGSALCANRKSGIRSVEDLLNKGREATFGGISASGLDLVPVLAIKVLGGSVNSVFGFEGSGEVRLARERGEIDLDFQSASTYISQIEPLIEEGEAVPLFTVGMLEDGEVGRDPAIPDVPTLEEVYRDIHGRDPSGPAYEAYHSFVNAGFFYQRAFWSNHGTSDEVVDTYALAVEALNSNEEYLEEAKGALGGYKLMPGKGNVEQIRDALTISSENLAYVRNFLIQEHDAVLD